MKEWRNLYKNKILKDRKSREEGPVDVRLKVIVKCSRPYEENDQIAAIHHNNRNRSINFWSILFFYFLKIDTLIYMIIQFISSWQRDEVIEASFTVHFWMKHLT